MLDYFCDNLLNPVEILHCALHTPPYQIPVSSQSVRPHLTPHFLVSKEDFVTTERSNLLLSILTHIMKDFTNPVEKSRLSLCWNVFPSELVTTSTTRLLCVTFVSGWIQRRQRCSDVGTIK